MRVDVRAMGPGERATVPVDGPIALQIDEQPVTVTVSGALQVDRTNRGVVVSGRVHAPVPLVCSRCLTPFQAAVAAEVEEEFTLDPGAGAHGGELGAEDFVSWVGPAHEIDLTEVIRQNLQMTVPMAPLHAEECRGLCPICGANWNERVCEHYGARGYGIRDKG